MNTSILPLKNKKVLIVGAGISGIEAAKLAHNKGALVTLNDIKKKQIEDLPEEIILEFGHHPEQLFMESDLIIVSPGVPQIPPLNKARSQNKTIIGEVELALQYIKSKIAAITGTNGKSTTVSLLGKLLESTGNPTFSGGNLGSPLSSIVDSEIASCQGLISLELSSFQLETIRSMQPAVAVLLNISEDHLSRYDSYEHYYKTKGQIFSGVQSGNHILSNYDDPLCRKLVAKHNKKAHWFSVNGNQKADFRLEGADLVFSGFDYKLPVSSVKIAGKHNLANILAAVGTALLMGINKDKIKQIVEEFKGLPHRMEFSGQINKIKFYNDSKATNVGSVIGSLSGFPTKYVLIMGGRHKGSSYKPLIPVLANSCRYVIAIGESAYLIKKDIEPEFPVLMINNLKEAIITALNLARSGEAVILSPACSSYDMYDNFKIRGSQFKKYVKNLS
ncbi:MAG: UDP-N-acetylmuramoyl-L-alanine--D-glutamate ligase [Deltaproteobacteria bacterium]|jgi:UDP-N-acetylmuramoylalanine--D-glutamate ligase|nr:UDP-N-acetylmuramoyl-L-alanine--D-glutamate ligase [Deltaproteobacteria bacterium]